jgi:hypothetical protein
MASIAAWEEREVNGPYRLIVTDDPCRTLAQGEARYFASMIDAANAFANATEPYRSS